MPAHDPGRERYQFLGEIARGGMGAVLKGRDTDLGRDLAVKVLLDRHKDNPGLIRRFIEEAQIGGQLQHPGIVPVYELGCFDDRRPFFTMKLVKGHTLAALLARRPDPAHDRPHFLGVFEAVCQTMAYSHARGVIHRDLKPGNIMVGSFGEVQVMDWGLAKVLRTESVIDQDTPESERETIVQTARSSSETHASHAGWVLGTPEYMPPEQARGELGAVDERADVFALGAILCEILTGQPPYSGRTALETQRKGTRGDLALALGRLAVCGAEAELVELTRRCLAEDARSRPRDAGDVARAMTVYLAGVQERLRAAEVARAQAQARTVEERRRRKTQFRMAACILLALAAGIGGAAYQWNRAEANYRKAQSRFDLARQAIERFYTGASEDVLLKEPQLKPLREKLLGSALEFYKKLQASLEAEAVEVPGADLAAAYEQVGRITGEVGSHSAAVDALQRARTIRQQLAEQRPESAPAKSALADVAEVEAANLGELGRIAEALEALQQARALRVRLADDRPDVVSNWIKLAATDSKLTNLLGYRMNRKRDALDAVERALAVYAGLTREQATLIEAMRGLADTYANAGLIRYEMGDVALALVAVEKALPIYEEMARRQPDDVDLREKLGRALLQRGYYATNLNRLSDAGRSYQSALATFQDLVRIQPNVSRYQLHLGRAHQSIAFWHKASGQVAAALREFETAVESFDRLDRDHPHVAEYVSNHALSLTNLGDALRASGRWEDALRALRHAQELLDRLVRDQPHVDHFQSDRASLQIVIASLLDQMGRRSEAESAYRTALASHEALAHRNGIDLYNLACAHARLGSLMSAESGGDQLPARRDDAARHFDLAMAALSEAASAGYRVVRTYATDPDLSPLRSRSDFQGLMMDLAFPAAPFAR